MTFNPGEYTMKNPKSSVKGVLVGIVAIVLLGVFTNTNAQVVPSQSATPFINSVDIPSTLTHVPLLFRGWRVEVESYPLLPYYPHVFQSGGRFSSYVIGDLAFRTGTEELYLVLARLGLNPDQLLSPDLLGFYLMSQESTTIALRAAVANLPAESFIGRSVGGQHLLMIIRKSENQPIPLGSGITPIAEIDVNLENWPLLSYLRGVAELLEATPLGQSSFIAYCPLENWSNLDVCFKSHSDSLFNNYRTTLVFDAPMQESLQALSDLPFATHEMVLAQQMNIILQSADNNIAKDNFLVLQAIQQFGENRILFVKGYDADCFQNETLDPQTGLCRLENIQESLLSYNHCSDGDIYTHCIVAPDRVPIASTVLDTSTSPTATVVTQVEEIRSLGIPSILVGLGIHMSHLGLGDLPYIPWFKQGEITASGQPVLDVNLFDPNSPTGIKTSTAIRVVGNFNPDLAQDLDLDARVTYNPLSSTEKVVLSVAVPCFQGNCDDLQIVIDVLSIRRENVGVGTDVAKYETLESNNFRYINRPRTRSKFTEGWLAIVLETQFETRGVKDFVLQISGKPTGEDRLLMPSAYINVDWYEAIRPVVVAVSILAPTSLTAVESASDDIAMTVTFNPIEFTPSDRCGGSLPCRVVISCSYWDSNRTMSTKYSTYELPRQATQAICPFAENIIGPAYYAITVGGRFGGTFGPTESQTIFATPVPVATDTDPAILYEHGEVRDLQVDVLTVVDSTETVATISWKPPFNSDRLAFFEVMIHQQPQLSTVLIVEAPDGDFSRIEIPNFVVRQNKFPVSTTVVSVNTLGHRSTPVYAEAETEDYSPPEWGPSPRRVVEDESFFLAPRQRFLMSIYFDSISENETNLMVTVSVSTTSSRVAFDDKDNLKETYVFTPPEDYVFRGLVDGNPYWIRYCLSDEQYTNPLCYISGPHIPVDIFAPTTATNLVYNVGTYDQSDFTTELYVVNFGWFQPYSEEKDTTRLSVTIVTETVPVGGDSTVTVVEFFGNSSTATSWGNLVLHQEQEVTFFVVLSDDKPNSSTASLTFTLEDNTPIKEIQSSTFTDAIYSDGSFNDDAILSTAREIYSGDRYPHVFVSPFIPEKYYVGDFSHYEVTLNQERCPLPRVTTATRVINTDSGDGAWIQFCRNGELAEITMAPVDTADNKSTPLSVLPKTEGIKYRTEDRIPTDPPSRATMTFRSSPTSVSPYQAAVVFGVQTPTDADLEALTISLSQFTEREGSTPVYLPIGETIRVELADTNTTPTFVGVFIPGILASPNIFVELNGTTVRAVIYAVDDAGLNSDVPLIIEEVTLDITPPSTPTVAAMLFGVPIVSVDRIETLVSVYVVQPTIEGITNYEITLLQVDPNGETSQKRKLQQYSVDPLANEVTLFDIVRVLLDGTTVTAILRAIDDLGHESFPYSISAVPDDLTAPPIVKNLAVTWEEQSTNSTERYVITVTFDYPDNPYNDTAGGNICIFTDIASDSKCYPLFRPSFTGLSDPRETSPGTAVSAEFVLNREQGGRIEVGLFDYVPNHSSTSTQPFMLVDTTLPPPIEGGSMLFGPPLAGISPPVAKVTIVLTLPSNRGDYGSVYALLTQDPFDGNRGLSLEPINFTLTESDRATNTFVLEFPEESFALNGSTITATITAREISLDGGFNSESYQFSTIPPDITSPRAPVFAGSVKFRIPLEQEFLAMTAPGQIYVTPPDLVARFVSPDTEQYHVLIEHEGQFDQVRTIELSDLKRSTDTTVLSFPVDFQVVQGDGSTITLTVIAEDRVLIPSTPATISGVTLDATPTMSPVSATMTFVLSAIDPLKSIARISIVRPQDEDFAGYLLDFHQESLGSQQCSYSLASDELELSEISLDIATKCSDVVFNSDGTIVIAIIYALDRVRARGDGGNLSEAITLAVPTTDRTPLPQPQLEGPSTPITSGTTSTQTDVRFDFGIIPSPGETTPVEYKGQIIRKGFTRPTDGVFVPPKEVNLFSIPVNESNMYLIAVQIKNDGTTYTVAIYSVEDSGNPSAPTLLAEIATEDKTAPLIGSVRLSSVEDSDATKEMYTVTGSMSVPLNPYGDSARLNGDIAYYFADGVTTTEGTNRSRNRPTAGSYPLTPLIVDQEGIATGIAKVCDFDNNCSTTMVEIRVMDTVAPLSPTSISLAFLPSQENPDDPTKGILLVNLTTPTDVDVQGYEFGIYQPPGYEIRISTQMPPSSWMILAEVDLDGTEIVVRARSFDFGNGDDPSVSNYSDYIETSVITVDNVIPSTPLGLGRTFTPVPDTTSATIALSVTEAPDKESLSAYRALIRQGLGNTLILDKYFPIDVVNRTATTYPIEIPSSFTVQLDGLPVEITVIAVRRNNSQESSPLVVDFPTDDIVDPLAPQLAMGSEIGLSSLETETAVLRSTVSVVPPVGDNIPNTYVMTISSLYETPDGDLIKPVPDIIETVHYTGPPDADIVEIAFSDATVKNDGSVLTVTIVAIDDNQHSPATELGSIYTRDKTFPSTPTNLVILVREESSATVESYYLDISFDVPPNIYEDGATLELALIHVLPDGTRNTIERPSRQGPNFFTGFLPPPVLDQEGIAILEMVLCDHSDNCRFAMTQTTVRDTVSPLPPYSVTMTVVQNPDDPTKGFPAVEIRAAEDVDVKGFDLVVRRSDSLNEILSTFIPEELFNEDSIYSAEFPFAVIVLDGTEVTAQVRSLDFGNGDVPSVSNHSEYIVTTVVTPDNRRPNTPKSASLEITPVIGKMTKGSIVVIVEQAEDRGDLLGYRVVIAHELEETPILDHFFDITSSESAGDDEYIISPLSDITVSLDGSFLQTTVTAVLKSNSLGSLPYFFETKSPDIVSPSTPTGLRIEYVENSTGNKEEYTVLYTWNLPLEGYDDPSSLKVIVETETIPVGESTTETVIILPSDATEWRVVLLQEQQTTLTVVVSDTTLNSASSSTTRMIVDTTSPAAPTPSGGLRFVSIGEESVSTQATVFFSVNNPNLPRDMRGYNIVISQGGNSTPVFVEADYTIDEYSYHSTANNIIVVLDGSSVTVLIHSVDTANPPNSSTDVEIVGVTEDRRIVETPIPSAPQLAQPSTVSKFGTTSTQTDVRLEYEIIPSPDETSVELEARVIREGFYRPDTGEFVPPKEVSSFSIPVNESNVYSIAVQIKNDGITYTVAISFVEDSGNLSSPTVLTEILTEDKTSPQIQALNIRVVEDSDATKEMHTISGSLTPSPNEYGDSSSILWVITHYPADGSVPTSITFTDTRPPGGSYQLTPHIVFQEGIAEGYAEVCDFDNNCSSTMVEVRVRDTVSPLSPTSISLAFQPSLQSPDDPTKGILVVNLTTPTDVDVQGYEFLVEQPAGNEIRFSTQLPPSNLPILVEVDFDGTEIVVRARSFDFGNGDDPSVPNFSDYIETSVITVDNRRSNPPKSARLEINPIGETTKGTIAVIVEQAEDRGDLSAYRVVIAELGETPILDQFFDIPSEFAADDEHAIPLPSDVTIPLNGLFLQTTITAVLAINSRESVPYFFETESPNIISPPAPTPLGGLRFASIGEETVSTQATVLFTVNNPNLPRDMRGYNIVISQGGNSTPVFVEVDYTIDEYSYDSTADNIIVVLDGTTVTVLIHSVDTANPPNSSTDVEIVGVTEDRRIVETPIPSAPQLEESTFTSSGTATTQTMLRGVFKATPPVDATPVAFAVVVTREFIRPNTGERVGPDVISTVILPILSSNVSNEYPYDVQFLNDGSTITVAVVTVEDSGILSAPTVLAEILTEDKTSPQILALNMSVVEESDASTEMYIITGDITFLNEYGDTLSTYGEIIHYPADGSDPSDPFTTFHGTFSSTIVFQEGIATGYAEVCDFDNNCDTTMTEVRVRDTVAPLSPSSLTMTLLPIPDDPTRGFIAVEIIAAEDVDVKGFDLEVHQPDGNEILTTFIPKDNFNEDSIYYAEFPLALVNFDGTEVIARARSRDSGNGDDPSIPNTSAYIEIRVLTDDREDTRIPSSPKSARLEITQVGKTTKGTIVVIVEQAEDRGDLSAYLVTIAQELGETPIDSRFYNISSVSAADDEYIIRLPSDITVSLDGLVIQTTVIAVQGFTESLPYFFEMKSPDIVSPSTPTGLRIEYAERFLDGEKRFDLSLHYNLPPNSYDDPALLEVIFETEYLAEGRESTRVVLSLPSTDVRFMQFMNGIPNTVTLLREQQTTLTVVVYDTTLNSASSSTTRMIVDTTSPPSPASVSATLIPIEGTTTASVQLEIVHPVEGIGDIVTYYVTVSQPSTNTWTGEYTLTEADRQSDRVTWLIPTNELTVELNGETIMTEVSSRDGSQNMSVDVTATTVATPPTPPPNP